MGKLKEKLQLSTTELAELKPIMNKGRHSVIKVKRAQILLKLNDGKRHSDVAEAVGGSRDYFKSLYYFPNVKNKSFTLLFNI